MGRILRHPDWIVEAEEVALALTETATSPAPALEYGRVADAAAWGLWILTMLHVL